jgi:hypothetical protein
MAASLGVSREVSTLQVIGVSQSAHPDPASWGCPSKKEGTGVTA